MKGCWKEHPDLVYSVAREAVGAWATVEQADKLRGIQSCPKGAVARADNAKEEKGVLVGRGGQRSSAHSGDSKPRGSCRNCGKEGHRMAHCTTNRKSWPPEGPGTAGKRVTGWPPARPSGSRGPQEGSNRPLLSLMVRPLGSSPLSSKV